MARLKLPEILTQEEVRSLLSAPSGSGKYALRDKTILELLYSEGLRVSELVSINYEDINFVTGLIKIRGKGSKERLLPLGTQAMLRLIECTSLMRCRSGAVFMNKYGRRISARMVRYLVSFYGELAGIRVHVHPHMLRHASATHMLDNGADLRYIQEFLGHSSILTTQFYTHVSKKKLMQTFKQFHPRA